MTGAVLAVLLVALAATPASPEDGATLALDLVSEDANGRLYALTYGSDGLRVRGFLGLPRSPGRHAAIVFNRGGNRDFGALEGWELAPLVRAGYVVAASQYRGNGGGEGRDEFGGADVHDVTNLVRLLKARPDVDSARIGMFGISRGAMMTCLALKAQALAGTRDVKAAVVLSGLYDLFRELDERPEMLRRVFWPLIGTTPQQDPEAYAARSAVRWPGLLRAPLLVLHGDADDRTPVAAARELTDGIRKAGGTVELVVFPGGNHGLSTHHYAVDETLAWFARHLGPARE